MKKGLGLIAVGALVAVVPMGAGAVLAGDIETDGKVVSTANSGPPLAVSSTEMVDNLNADQLDGLEGSDLYTQAEVDTLVADLQAQIDSLGVGALVLVDSLGVTVGPVVELEFDELSDGVFDVSYAVAVFRNGDDMIFLQTTTGSSLRIGGPVYFQLSDCQGDAYVSQTGGPLQENAYHTDHRNIVYRKIDGFDDSALSWSDQGQCINNPVGGSWRNATPVLDLDDFFTQPYHVE